MKTSSKIALSLLAAASLATSSLVLAHDHEHGRHGYGPMEHCQKGGPGAHLDALKTKLKLTAKQQPAWETFEKAVRAQMAAHRDGHHMRHGMAGNPDAMMQAHITFMEQRLAGMKAILKARTALEQVLTPEQKKVFDQFGPHHHRHG